MLQNEINQCHALTQSIDRRRFNKQSEASSRSSSNSTGKIGLKYFYKFLIAEPYLNQLNSYFLTTTKLTTSGGTIRRTSMKSTRKTIRRSTQEPRQNRKETTRTATKSTKGTIRGSTTRIMTKSTRNHKNRNEINKKDD
ncbi:hypothetical protein Glove_521g46 [Diversispora epigaea]|uniref:Uncharacterized protein n=1 Tax=Diversispora epigaea TaxID=1348612 RepID=A0A397GI38_9GLOM|nr:hypothetical protein Glove_521g46 [Diversispora epigaea]